VKRHLVSVEIPLVPTLFVDLLLRFGPFCNSFWTSLRTSAYFLSRSVRVQRSMGWALFPAFSFVPSSLASSVVPILVPFSFCAFLSVNAMKLLFMTSIALSSSKKATLIALGPWPVAWKSLIRLPKYQRPRRDRCRHRPLPVLHLLIYHHFPGNLPACSLFVSSGFLKFNFFRNLLVWF